MTLTELGRIAILQVQRASLKKGERPNRWYDPEPLVRVPHLRLSAPGAVGVTGEGETLVDIHNASHPQSKNDHGKNGLSIGFTGHYALMREAYGAHLADGCAGENVIVEAGRRMRLADLGEALAIEDAAGGRTLLVGVHVAAPCLEFSRFVNRAAKNGDDLRATVQFLHEGLRGFYARLADALESADLREGQRVYAVQDLGRDP